MSKMITVRMSEDRVQAIDRLVAQLESERIDREIVEGYTRIPSTPEEDAWAEWSVRESIREEPW